MTLKCRRFNRHRHPIRRTGNEEEITATKLALAESRECSRHNGAMKQSSRRGNSAAREERRGQVAGVQCQRRRRGCTRFEGVGGRRVWRQTGAIKMQIISFRAAIFPEEAGVLATLRRRRLTWN